MHPDNNPINTSQTNSTTKKTKPKKISHHHLHPFRWIFVIILIIAGSFGGYWGYTKYNNSYNSLNAANTLNNIVMLNKEYAKSNKFTYEFYWKLGCKDCESIQKQGIIPMLHKAQKQNNLIAINTTKFKRANSAQAKDWFTDNNFGSVPTLIVKYHGYPIYLYTGTNINKFKQLLNETNPTTHKKLQHKVANQELIDNDFDKSLTTTQSQNPVTGQ